MNDRCFTGARYSEFTALHFAAGEGRKDVCVLLIEAGADVNAKNGDGLTPLQIAKQDAKAAMNAAIQRLGINYATDTRKKAGSVIKSGIAPANPLVAREAKAGKIGVRKQPGSEEGNGDTISFTVNDNSNGPNDFQYENQSYQGNSSTTFAYDPFAGSSGGYSESYEGGSYMTGGHFGGGNDSQQGQNYYYQGQQQQQQEEEQGNQFEFSNPSHPSAHHQGSSGFI